MKNLLVLHGAGNNHLGNWFPWLKIEAERLGYITWSPDMPNSDKPNLKLWSKTIFSNPNWKFDSESVLVGHSAGATFILRILEQLPTGVKVNKAIMVAGPIEIGTKPEFFQYKEDLVKLPFNWEKIKDSCKSFYFIHSDNDPYQCGIDQGRKLHEQLGGKLIYKKDEGHFNLEQSPNYSQFPELLNYILE